MAAKGSKKAARSRKSSGSDRTYTVGIDLGGTKVAAALVDANGDFLNEVKKPTVPPFLQDQDIRHQYEPSAKDVKRHIDYLIDAMADTVDEATMPLREKTVPGRLIGIGLASAGPMDIEAGTLENPANFKGWKRVPLVRLLREALAERGIRSPIVFQNDAIAAALGEGWTGRAKNCGTYVMITVGTGIGTGVIFNGKPAQSRGMGSEWGHIIAHAPGLSKEPLSHYERSVEGLASGTGLALRAHKRGLKGATAAHLAEAARDGNKVALELFEGAAEGLAALMTNLSLGFHPEVFVVSGGMLAIRDLFLPRAIEIYREIMKDKYPDFLAPVKVSKLGTRAGVIGSARLPRL